VQEKYRTIGVDIVQPHAPEAFGDMLKREIDRWGAVIRDAKVKID